MMFFKERFEFQLNTIQRLTETRMKTRHKHNNDVPIKHYPTINWNYFDLEKYSDLPKFQLNTIQRLTETKDQSHAPDGYAGSN